MRLCVRHGVDPVPDHHGLHRCPADCLAPPGLLRRGRALMATDVRSTDGSLPGAGGSALRSVDLAARKRQLRANLKGICLHLLVGGVGLCYFFPVFWMLLASTRTDADSFHFPPRIIPP